MKIELDLNEEQVFHLRRAIRNSAKSANAYLRNDRNASEEAVSGASACVAAMNEILEQVNLQTREPRVEPSMGLGDWLRQGGFL